MEAQSEEAGLECLPRGWSIDGVAQIQTVSSRQMLGDGGIKDDGVGALLKESQYRMFNVCYNDTYSRVLCDVYGEKPATREPLQSRLDMSWA